MTCKDMLRFVKTNQGSSRFAEIFQEISPNERKCTDGMNQLIQKVELLPVSYSQSSTFALHVRQRTIVSRA